MSEVAHVKGLAELGAVLGRLPERIEKNITVGALRAGAKVLRDQARANAPVGEPSSENVRLYGLYRGALRDSIRARTSAKWGTVTAKITAGGAAKRGAVVYYAHMIEWGTKPHKINAIKVGGAKALGVGQDVFDSVIHPGIARRPFMRPAMDNSGQAVLTAVAGYIRARLAETHGIDVPPPAEEE